MVSKATGLVHEFPPEEEVVLAEEESSKIGSPKLDTEGTFVGFSKWKALGTFRLFVFS